MALIASGLLALGAGPRAAAQERGAAPSVEREAVDAAAEDEAVEDDSEDEAREDAAPADEGPAGAAPADEEAGDAAIEGAAVEDATVEDEPVEDEPVGGSEAAEEPLVERRYVRGVGRGLYYGADLFSPIYLTEVRRDPTNERLVLGGGAGLHARIGWELPAGFSVELFGGFAVSGVDTRGLSVSALWTRVDLGVAGRYQLFNDTPWSPFVELGLQARWLWFDWSLSRTEVDAAAGFAVQAAVGVQLELSPYFSLEAGLAVDYGFSPGVLQEGLLSLAPFAGATLYVYDENDPVF